MMPSLTVTGRRIYLRLATVADAEEMLAAMDPAATTNLQFFAERAEIHRQQEYLGRMYVSANDILFAIIRAENNAIIGTVGLHEIDHHLKLARAGVLIFRPTDRLQGFADEALKLVIKCAFTELALNKVHVNPFRKKNGHVAYFETLGFKVEGVLREEYLLNGVYHDLVRMGLLAREWRDTESTKEDR